MFGFCKVKLMSHLEKSDFGRVVGRKSCCCSGENKKGRDGVKRQFILETPLLSRVKGPSLNAEMQSATWKERC